MIKLLTAAILGLLACTASSFAQDAYPERAVTIIVPFAPGGQTDSAARILGSGLEKTLGKPFVVENKTGAGGVIGTQFAAAAEPDGYTLVVGGPSTLVTQPLLAKNISYNVKVDFVPVANFANATMVLVVKGDSEFKTLGDLIAAGKERDLAYGSSGIGSSMHLGTEWFKHITQMKTVHVPFRGSSQSLVALLGGEIDFLIDPPITAMPLVQDGQLRALAVTGRTPDVKLADLPTMSDAGAPGYQQLIWNSLMAPAGTPPVILDKLDSAIKKVLADPEIIKQLDSLSLPVAYRHRDDFSKFLLEEDALYKKIIDDNKITLDE
ncbi:tripartite tricarboxylate transporter substrate binding protein [Mesorhizobium sp. CCNWLW179-1]|uniref:Bug family tripartite tricarboxylate transporter substrate binding protein n=1 Tax=unclassified Mesorhizobium TaxID=325217 RepID=UPI0030156580